MGSFKSYWWKLLGVALVTYAVVMSFIIPLSPGLISVDKFTLSTGEQKLIIDGYSTHLAEPGTEIWLSSNERKFLIPGKIIRISGDQQAEVSFIIPDTLPSNALDLLMTNDRDGLCVMNAAVYVAKEDVAIKAGLTTAGMKVKALDSTRFTFPFRSMLYESIRNLNFHVTMWFALMLCMLIGAIKSVQFLSKGDLTYDRWANESVNTGLLFGGLGLVTGAIWARFTWGDWWTSDPKLNGAAISMLIYAAYVVLRNSIQEEQKRARIAAVYNIFAFIMLIVFIQILPRMTDSLHPGNGGNPAFSQYDLDNHLRKVFYPACLGWMLIGAWIITIRSRWSNLNHQLHHA